MHANIRIGRSIPKYLVSVDEGHVSVPPPKPRQARGVHVELRVLPACVAHQLEVEDQGF